MPELPVPDQNSAEQAFQASMAGADDLQRRMKERLALKKKRNLTRPIEDDAEADADIDTDSKESVPAVSAEQEPAAAEDLPAKSTDPEKEKFGMNDQVLRQLEGIKVEPRNIEAETATPKVEEGEEIEGVTIMSDEDLALKYGPQEIKETVTNERLQEVLIQTLDLKNTWEKTDLKAAQAKEQREKIVRLLAERIKLLEEKLKERGIFPTKEAEIKGWETARKQCAENIAKLKAEIENIDLKNVNALKNLNDITDDIESVIGDWNEQLAAKKTKGEALPIAEEVTKEYIEDLEKAATLALEKKKLIAEIPKPEASRKEKAAEEETKEEIGKKIGRLGLTKAFLQSYEVEIDKKKMSLFEAFDALSPAETLMFLDELDQVTYSHVQKSAQEKHEAAAAEAVKDKKKAAAIFASVKHNFGKTGKIRAHQKQIAEDLVTGKGESEKKKAQMTETLLKSLASRKKQEGISVVVSSENPKEYVLEFAVQNNGSKFNKFIDKKIFDDFNKAASNFSRLPDEQTLKTTGLLNGTIKKQMKAYQEAKNRLLQAELAVMTAQYDDQINKIKNNPELSEAQKKFAIDDFIETAASNEVKALDTKVKISQLNNNHPNAAAELDKLSSGDGILRGGLNFIKGQKTTRDVYTMVGIAAGSGALRFGVKTAQYWGMGTAGLTGAAAGFARGWFRAGKTLREKELEQRRGKNPGKNKETEDKTVALLGERQEMHKKFTELEERKAILEAELVSKPKDAALKKELKENKKLLADQEKAYKANVKAMYAMSSKNHDKRFIDLDKKDGGYADKLNELSSQLDMTFDDFMKDDELKKVAQVFIKNANARSAKFFGDDKASYEKTKLTAIDEKTFERMKIGWLEKLKGRVDFMEKKLNEGLVNLGPEERRLGNRDQIIDALAKAQVSIANALSSDLLVEAGKEYVDSKERDEKTHLNEREAHLKKVTGDRDNLIQVRQNEHKFKQALKYAALGVVGAEGGYGIGKIFSVLFHHPADIAPLEKVNKVASELKKMSPDAQKVASGVAKITAVQEQVKVINAEMNPHFSTDNPFAQHGSLDHVSNLPEYRANYEGVDKDVYANAHNMAEHFSVHDAAIGQDDSAQQALDGDSLDNYPDMPPNPYDSDAIAKEFERKITEGLDLPPASSGPAVELPSDDIDNYQLIPPNPYDPESIAKEFERRVTEGLDLPELQDSPIDIHSEAYQAGLEAKAEAAARAAAKAANVAKSATVPNAEIVPQAPILEHPPVSTGHVETLVAHNQRESHELLLKRRILQAYKDAERPISDGEADTKAQELLKAAYKGKKLIMHKGDAFNIVVDENPDNIHVELPSASHIPFDSFPEHPTAPIVETINNHQPGRIIDDSADRSLLRTLRNPANAEKLGFVGNKATDQHYAEELNTWANEAHRQILNTHHELRTLVTHDGNQLSVQRDQDGAWHALVEKAKGLTPDHPKHVRDHLYGGKQYDPIAIHHDAAPSSPEAAPLPASAHEQIPSASAHVDVANQKPAFESLADSRLNPVQKEQVAESMKHINYGLDSFTTNPESGFSQSSDTDIFHVMEAVVSENGKGKLWNGMTFPQRGRFLIGLAQHLSADQKMSSNFFQGVTKVGQNGNFLDIPPNTKFNTLQALIGGTLENAKDDQYAEPIDGLFNRALNVQGQIFDSEKDFDDVISVLAKPKNLQIFVDTLKDKMAQSPDQSTMSFGLVKDVLRDMKFRLKAKIDW